MSALTYWDYLGIALFVIVFYFVVKILDELISSIICSYINDKKDTSQLPSVFYLLESSYSYEVTMSEVEKALQADMEQGVIISYTIGKDFIVYRQKDGRKVLIDLSRYNVN